jgi:hypothetical protein
MSSVSDTALSAVAGDVNGSGGDPDLADAVLTLQILFSINIGNQTIFKDADVNGDGKIGIFELIYILQKVAGLR